MKYKLIKLLPFENSPRIGYTSEPHLSQKDEDHYWNGLWFNPENYPEFWEEVVEKDYEILKLSLQRSIKHQIVSALENSEDYTISLLRCNGNKIHSVKRLSDGEIFTIGDEIIYNEIFPTKLKIKSIQLFNGEILIHKDCTMNTNKLSEIQHYKEPLFTTEDGVDIFKGDKYWKVNNDLNLSNRQKATGSTSDLNPAKYFSTKEKAEEYILMNKPVLSLKDVASIYISADKPITDTTSFSAQNRRIQDLVKSKIQQSV